MSSRENVVRCGGADVPLWEPGFESPGGSGDSRLKDNVI